MTILLIHDKRAPTGGVQAYLGRLRAMLQAAGHRVLMLRLERGGRLRREAGEEFVSGTVAGPWRGSRPLRDLINLVRSEAPDIVHLHGVFTNLGPAAVGALHRLCPTVVTLHDIRPLHAWGLAESGLQSSPVLARWICGGASFRHRLKAALLRRRGRALLPVYRRLDRILVANSLFRDELLRHGFPAEKIAFVPLFVGTPGDAGPSDPAPGAAAPPGSGGGDAPLVLFVGRLGEEKGILPFMSLLGRLRGSWRAEIVGDGPLEAEARRLASSLATGRVTIRSGRPAARMQEVYGACRVLVVPSLIPENFGLVGVEAMAAGRAVVGFRQVGITEWLRDGVNGFLVTPGDVAGLAARVQELIDSPQRAAAMGERGREIARDEFSLERHMRLLTAVYEQALRRAA